MDLSLAIIGPGSVGRVMVKSVRDAGFTVEAVLGRGDDLASIPKSVDVVLICVPDDAIAEVAVQLATTRPEWTGCIAAHVSGALTAEVLSPLANLGAACASFHPLSTYPPDGPVRDLGGTIVAMEGDKTAVDLLTQVATRMRGKPAVIRSDQKGAYHMAASMASNYLVTLADMVQTVLAAADLDAHLMDGLVSDTISNLESAESAKDALTGPISRGDVETVRAHLGTLRSAAPSLMATYCALARETVRLTIDAGRIDQSTATQLLELLNQ